MIVIMRWLLGLTGVEIEGRFFIGGEGGIFCILRSLCRCVGIMAKYGCSLREVGCIFILLGLTHGVCR